MQKLITSILILFFLTTFSFLQAFGDETPYKELLNEIKALKKRVAELEEKVVQQKSKTLEVEKVAHGVRREFKEFIKYKPGEGIEVPVAGLVIGGDVTFIAQGTPNANNAGGGEDSIFDASWSSDIEIEKSFGDWGLAFLHLEAGQNDSIESELSVFSNVNRDAGDTGANVQVTEAWYEHYFLDQQFILTAGKLDATCYLDQNEYANDETTQFLGHIFRNSPNIEWPADNNLGIRGYLCVEPIDFLEFELGYFEADGDWDDIFDHAFYMAQVNVKLADIFDIDAEQWGGNYRFYWWINGQHHTRFVDEGDTTDDTKEMNYGFGLSFDQMITDVFGVFTRFGWQRPNVALIDGSATLECAWSAGAQMTGSYWNREDDVLAFAIGQAFPSKKWKDASSNNYGAGEGHIEAYYKCQLNECLAISPDLQVIWNPNGVSKSSQGDNDAIFVYGVRAQVDF